MMQSVAYFVEKNVAPRDMANGSAWNIFFISILLFLICLNFFNFLDMDLRVGHAMTRYS